MRHTCKMEKLKIRAVIKYFCKKGKPPKEIREDVIETLGKESPSYNSTLKNWAAEFERERESVEDGGRRESVEDGGRYGRPKDATADKMSRSCTPWLCVIGGETCEA